MTKEHKLYRDGKFFDLRADPFEEKPRRTNQLTASESAAVQKLQAVLDQYAEARPARLREPHVTAKQSKKAQRKGKRDDNDR
jgi:hypothetical protein